MIYWLVLVRTGSAGSGSAVVLYKSVCHLRNYGNTSCCFLFSKSDFTQFHLKKTFFKTLFLSRFFFLKHFFPRSFTGIFFSFFFYFSTKTFFSRLTNLLCLMGKKTFFLTHEIFVSLFFSLSFTSGENDF